MRALGLSNCSGLWKTRRNDQGLPHGLEATKRGERSATPLWTNRFLPNKRPAQAMINWHGLNIQAGGSWFRISPLKIKDWAMRLIESDQNPPATAWWY